MVQVKIAQRIGLIQHLPTGTFDGCKKNREWVHWKSVIYIYISMGMPAKDLCHSKCILPFQVCHLHDWVQCGWFSALPTLHAYLPCGGDTILWRHNRRWWWRWWTYMDTINDSDFPQCIDDWLMRSFTCPSCMEPVDAALLGEFKIYQKNMSWFWWTPCFNFLLRLNLVNWFTISVAYDN